MRNAIKYFSIIATIICIAWLYYKPGYDSASAAASSIVVLLSSLFLKTDKNKPAQKQNVSENSVAIQAGRNVNVRDIKK